MAILRRRERNVQPPAVETIAVRPASTPPRDVVDRVAQLRAVLDALPVGVVLTDEAGRVILRNRTAEHPAGVHHGDILVDEAVETHVRAAMAGEDEPQTLNLFGPPARVLVIRAERVSGGGALATIEDATERARLDAIRTDFVSNIGHELKTPVGALSILSETLADSDDLDVVRRLADKIVQESTRLARTIDDLLELSRIELGGEALREPVAAGLVLDDANERVRPLADQRHIKVLVESTPLALTALGDRRQLVSALGNLIENAVKYSEPDGCVEVSATREGAMVAFQVRDHGIGIPPQHLDRIFERFYRVDRARSRETGGTGLGLAIVRHVATNHGGEVTVTSAEGEGSTFVLRIPADPTEADTEEATPEVAGTSGARDGM